MSVAGVARGFKVSLMCFRGFHGVSSEFLQSSGLQKAQQKFYKYLEGFKVMLGTFREIQGSFNPSKKLGAILHR